MSTRRVQTTAGQANFDHGAQYFTVRDPAFQTVVRAWQDAGVVALWTAAGPEAWVGVPAMNTPVKALAARHEVKWSVRIDGLRKADNGWQLQSDVDLADRLFDLVILAIPAEQAAPILAPWETGFHNVAVNTVSAPCWTLMLAFADPVKTAKIIIRDDAVIGWAARNSDKPGRTGPDSWVIQATPEWSVKYLESSPDQVVSALSDRFASLLGQSLPDPLIATAHRWRYARSARANHEALYSDDLKIGACGDWMLGPRVECAWLSGAALARMIPDCGEASDGV